MRSRQWVSHDDGETLVEVLIALSILAVGVTSILFALATGEHTGAFNRSQGQANTVLTAASEYVRSHAFYDCSGPSTTTLTGTQVPQGTGFTVSNFGPVNQSGVAAADNPWSSAGIACSDGIELMKVSVIVPGDAGISVSQYVSLFCLKPMTGATCPG